MEAQVQKFIKATTAYGGDDYPLYSGGYTEEGARAFREWIAYQEGVSDVTLFRGYSFDPRYWEDGMVEEGSIIGIDQMTQSTELPAFTEGPIRATLYMNEFGEVSLEWRERVFFEIKTHGKSFIDISPWSRYPEEKEYRCKEDTRLLVTGIKQKGGYLHITCEEMI